MTILPLFLKCYFYTIIDVLSIAFGFLVFSIPVYIISYLITGNSNNAFDPSFIFGMFGAVWGMMLLLNIMEYEDEEYEQRLKYCELKYGEHENIINEHVTQKKKALLIKEQVRKLVKEHSIGYIIECNDGNVILYNPFDDYIPVELLEHTIKTIAR